MRWLLLRALPVLAGALLLLTLIGVAHYAPLFDGMAEQRIERPAPGPRSAAPRRVLLVSIDGLSPRVLAGVRAPTLARLAEEGARTPSARTVLPSITMAAHTTMLTGLSPAQHGVSWNRYQPWSRVAAPTLFGRCREVGLRCGLFAGKRKFVHFAEGEAGVERYQWQPDAAAVLDAAASWLESADPDFAMIHLAEVDLAGHERGWGSPAQQAAIEATDRLLGVFLPRARAASGRPLVVLLTSDHGGHDTRHGTDQPADMEIPWLLWGDDIPPGHEISAPVTALDTAPTLMSLLGLTPPSHWPGTPHFPLN